MTTFQPWEGSGTEVCCISEFTGYLQNPDLSSKHNSTGWVFWYLKTEKEEKEKIQRVLEAVTSNFTSLNCEYMVQFWGMKEGCCLTTVDQPFAVVGPLNKGQCWYRKLCEANQYSVNEEEQVGRVYLKMNPESTPDLRLYSITEFPLQNEAAGCGLRSYLAVPVFDLHKQKCYGVLEIVSAQICIDSIFSLVDHGLKKAGLRSTHIGLSSPDPLNELTKAVWRSTYDDFSLTYKQPECEIKEMIKSAIELVPQLHLVQVWSPCKQCVNTSNNLSCMERISFMVKTLNYCSTMDHEIFQYLEACEFHHLQITKWIGRPLISADRKSCFCRNICDFSVWENPLAHYAQQARLSFCFVVHLQNVHHSNSNYLIEFFFQSNSREDGCDASFLHLLLKIMEKELIISKFEKTIVEIRKTSAITTYEYVEWKHQHSHSEEVNMLTVMNGHTETYSLSDIKNFFQKADLSCLQLCEEDKMQGWLFGREDIYDNGVNNNTALPNIPMHEKIKKLMTEIATEWVLRSYSLVQFWGVGMNEDRPCLRTSDQPFALGSLDKGLAFFRNKCMDRHYFVDEEVGPLQRVFRSGHPETSPDLRLYSTTEFPLKDHALHCLLRTYLAFPILDQHKQCIGVLECVGKDDDEVGIICSIQRALEAANLCSTHINFLTSPTRQVDEYSKLAETEICRALELFENIPRLVRADVWVTYNECDGISSNISCMELFQSSDVLDLTPINFRQVETGKGIIGMVLASENKSCFCRNSCDFSVADEPLAHYSQRDRLDVCFAICLQSSHTGDLLYVLQFFLHQGPAKYEYLSSFLHIIFPILKQQLISFKVASGQQLADDLVVDVIEFPQRNQLTSSELDESHSPPFKFKTVLYGQNEPQHSKNELPHFVPDVMDSVPSILGAKPCVTATSNSRKKNAAKEKLGRKRKGSLDIRLEDLPPHFGKTLVEVAEELGVGKSTLKRACRDLGINRWSKDEKYMKKVFEAIRTFRPPTNANTLLQPMTEAETVMVNAMYEADEIKFEFCLSSRMDKLKEEVGRRLDLEIGSFKLRYLDEDNRKILLTCDDDLQLCFKGLTVTAMGKTTLQVFVQLILSCKPEIVMVKAIYEADEIKFELCLSSRMDKLKEEVGRRFDLKIGSFKLRYLDEDNHKILLTCDDDLQLCLRSLTAGDRTIMQGLRFHLY